MVNSIFLSSRKQNEDTTAKGIQLVHVVLCCTSTKQLWRASMFCQQTCLASCSHPPQACLTGHHSVFCDLSKAELVLLQVLQQEIVIKPGDSDIVRLSILPLKPGLLKVTGLEWVLNGEAQGRRLFAAKAPQHRRTGSR